MYKEGVYQIVDSEIVLMEDKELERIILQPEYKDLIWNHYFEDIGEERKY